MSSANQGREGVHEGEREGVREGVHEGVRESVRDVCRYEFRGRGNSIALSLQVMNFKR